ncbi:CopK family periplasmic copper-binding protein [Propionivibrio soli]|uniref:CopK family periplasmic copper-binding protein n=1 Tax=Propionivibrio soli TaxID=2976531 RepID=UPI0021E85708|nr:CopK family periplasmic copper-binding protein [Propionivibrio soli]
MLKKTMILVALSAVSAFAGASELDARQEAKQVVDLQDGSTLYVFDSGKTALQNKYGQPVSIAPGSTLKAKDGHEIRTVGNEVARLDYLLKLGMGV